PCAFARRQAGVPSRYTDSEAEASRFCKPRAAASPVVGAGLGNSGRVLDPNEIATFSKQCQGCLCSTSPQKTALETKLQVIL
ncbi:unnamed protein product, partial [Gulo gulo]